MATSQSELEALILMTKQMGALSMHDVLAALIIDLREVYLRLSELELLARQHHAGWDNKNG